MQKSSYLKISRSLIICSAVAIALTILYIISSLKEPTITPQYPITPKTTVFAFDIHEVLFKNSYKEQLSIAIHEFLPRPVFIKHVLNPLVWYSTIKLLFRSNVSEYIFNQLTVEYPQLKELYPAFMHFANAQHLMPGMLELVQALKHAGFHLYILSNIGPHVFDILKQQHPYIFSLFDGRYTPDFANNFISKPDPLFYEQFKNYIKKHEQQDKQIIFIDDRKANIKSAQKLGIIGIQFISPEKLKDTLNTIGLKDLNLLCT
jgi:HAD superfamily hydrolase (TIGR01509 family)